MYRIPDLSHWKGRNDPLDGPEAQRWHHLILDLNLSQKIEDAKGGHTSFAFLGFCCDEGVRRNLGRTGAREGPGAFRKAMKNLALHHDPSLISLFDAGDVICPEDRLESTQAMLGEKILQLLSAGYKPIVMGGGHEIAFGHFLGIHKFAEEKNQTVGILNLDAHLDLRKYDVQGNSGTPFLQIHEKLASKGLPFNYLVLGIREAANTKALFHTARELNVGYHPADSLRSDNLGTVFSAIEKFMSPLDAVYLSVDLDVIDQAHAPGVSAPSPFGLPPETVRIILRKILRSGKVLSLDIAELNPALDPDNSTARLAALFVYDIVSGWR